MSAKRTSGRAERLSERLPDAGVDVMLVTNGINVRYVTGFTGSNGIALAGAETRVFFTDFRYVEQAAAEVESSFDRRRSPQQLIEGVEDALPAGELRLGFEAAHMSVSEHAHLRELLPERIELIATTGLVEDLRAVKQPDELAAIRAATELADESFAVLLAGGLIGHSERDLAMTLEYEMRRRGAERPSFDPIVAGGPRGALPHARPRDTELRRGELVVIDWGAELDGYCSDCTRTVAAGPVDGAAGAVYRLVLDAQVAAVEDVRAGAAAREVDAVARSAIQAAGHGDQFGHGLGHGVGLEVHEGPRLAQRSEAVLAAGNVVTVEPGVYVPGKFGVRIEDLVVVRDDGCEILTSITKELVVAD